MAVDDDDDDDDDDSDSGTVPDFRKRLRRQRDKDRVAAAAAANGGTPATAAAATTAATAAEEEGGEGRAEGSSVMEFASDGTYRNKQRVLLFSSRGITSRFRHLLGDLRKLIPHHKKVHFAFFCGRFVVLQLKSLVLCLLACFSPWCGVARAVESDDDVVVAVKKLKLDEKKHPAPVFSFHAKPTAGCLDLFCFVFSLFFRHPSRSSSASASLLTMFTRDVPRCPPRCHCATAAAFYPGRQARRRPGRESVERCERDRGDQEL